MEQSIIDAFIEAVDASQWQVVAGIILMILAVLSRKLLGNIIPQKEMDLFVGGVAIVTFVGEALFSGRSILGAILSGFVVFGIAAGFWDLLGRRIKHWLKKDENTK